MQIIIDIPEENYNNICNSETASSYSVLHALDAIRNSKLILPKDHGRIMDVDKIIKKMEEREEKLKDDRSIWETAGVETAIDMFGETIIEAYKESEK